MFKGYWIIIGDGYSSGLNIVNPRLLDEDGLNWWSLDDQDITEIEIRKKHDLTQFKVAKIVLNHRP